MGCCMTTPSAQSRRSFASNHEVDRPVKHNPLDSNGQQRSRRLESGAGQQQSRRIEGGERQQQSSGERYKVAQEATSGSSRPENTEVMQPNQQLKYLSQDQTSEKSTMGKEGSKEQKKQEAQAQANAAAAATGQAQPAANVDPRQQAAASQQPALDMTEKPPGNLRASMTMIAKAPDLEKTIATLKVIAGQYAGAVETNRMEREPAFAEIVNSDGTVQFVKALTEIKERRVSKDYIEVVIQLGRSMLNLLKNELAAGRPNEHFAKAMAQVFNYEASIHQNYYQMSSKMIEEYQPMQEHKNDPCHRPFESGGGRGGRRPYDDDDDRGGRGRRPYDDDDDDYDRPDSTKKPVVLDTVIKHKTPGSDVVIYCLPRTGICQSRRCIDLINYFGNLGGFQLVIDALNTPAAESYSIGLLYSLSYIISRPLKLYHTDYVQPWGEAFVLRVVELILAQPLDQLKKQSNEQLDMFTNMIKDIITQCSGKERSYTPRLQVVKKYLECDALVLRRYSIKELNAVLLQASISAPEVLINLINWIKENGVFDVLWNAGKTHVELVKQSNKIFDALCKSNMMTPELFEAFWGLGRDPAFKAEVFDIIMKCRQLSVDHLQMIMSNIEATPPEKLTKEDFEVLAGNDKFKKELKQQTIEFFWRVLCNSSLYKEDTVASCVVNFSALTKSFSKQETKALWEQLGAQLANPEQGDTTLALINFFQPQIAREKPEDMIEEQDSDASYTDSEYEGDSDYSDSDDEDIPKHLRAKKKQADKKDEKQIAEMLKSLGNAFVDNLATNIGNYCVKSKAAFEAGALDNKGHEDQIKKRFDFLEEFLVAAEMNMAKEAFEQVYNLFSTSPIPQDQELFFTWCAGAAKRYALDEDEVFVFFSEKLEQNALNVKGLPVDGFNFLRDLFVNQNIGEQKLEKYEALSKHKRRHCKYTDIDVDFEVLADPQTLKNYQMIWEIVMQSQNESVVNKSIGLLVNCHVNLAEKCAADKSEVLQGLISQIFARFDQSQDDVKQIRRLSRVLKATIQISEKKGVNVQPHSALLNGEPIENVTVTYTVIDRRDYWCRPIVDREFVISTYTSATVWELKDLIAKTLGTLPRYVGLELPNEVKVTDDMNGTTLKELNLQSNSAVKVTRRGLPDRNLQKAELLKNKAFTPKATATVKELFAQYKDPATGKISKEQMIALLQRIARKEITQHETLYIEMIGRGAEAGVDGFEEAKFLSSFHGYAKQKEHHIHRYFKSCFIGKDFVKHTNMQAPPHLEASKMPRFTISANKQQFQKLFNLLEIADQEATNDVWEVVRMLATNQSVYDQVLSGVKEANIEWKNVFTDGNHQRETYIHEIAFDIMETNPLRGAPKVTFERNIQSFKICEADGSVHNRGGNFLELASIQDKISKDEKTDFAQKFLTQQGVAYVYQEIIESDVENSATDDRAMKNNAFLLALLRNNIEQAQEGGQLNEEQIGKVFQSAWKFLQVVVSLGENVNEDDKIIVDHAMVLIVKAIKMNNGLFGDFQSEANGASQLMMGGLLNHDKLIRQSFHSGLKDIPAQLAEEGGKVAAIDFLFNTLADNYFVKNDKRQNSHMFLQLLNDLCRIKAAIVGDQQMLMQITEVVVESILVQITAEQNSKIEKIAPKNEIEEAASKQRAQEREVLLQDLVLLLKSLLIMSGEAGQQLVVGKDVLGRLLREFLFVSYYTGLQERAIEDPKQSKTIVLTGSRAGNKTKNLPLYRQSRRDAYSLIAELLGANPGLMEQFVQENLVTLVGQINKPKGFSFRPTSTSGTNQKYVGLVNLQNICYMNSILQQFFMIPSFRYNLLCVEEQPSFKTAKKTLVKGEMVVDDMLYQTQKLIANLEASERNDYNMVAFCHAFKEFDGKPTDHRQQKDSSEFLGTFIDRLQDALRPTSRKYLISNTFGGKMCNQMVCPMPDGSSEIKNRIEDSFFLSVPIKGINSLQKSLEKTIEGEVISGYTYKGRSIDAKKRALMVTMPNVLVVHLQRIAFSMETFNNEKINSYCEFPNTLDLREYSYHGVMGREGLLKTPEQKAALEEAIRALEGQEDKQEELEDLMAQRDPEEDDCYTYKLVGCNVHHGTADSGHYWSYINTNRQKPDNVEEWMHTENDPWMEFNDRRVEDTRFSSLAGRCFGNAKNGRQQGQSAYVLFYVRTQQKDLNLVIPEDKVATLQNVAGLEVNKVGDEYQTPVPFMLELDKTQQSRELTEHLFRFPPMYYDVLQENKADAFESDAYSNEFIGFLPQLMDKIVETRGNLTEALKLATLEVSRKMSVEIMARIERIGSVTGITNAFMGVLQAEPSLLPKVVANFVDVTANKAAWHDLFVAYDDDDRANQEALVKFFTYCACALKGQEQEAIVNGEVEEYKMGNATMKRPKSVFVRVIRQMKQVLLGTAYKTPHNAQAFFAMYAKMLKFSGEEILADATEHDVESEAFKMGMKAFYNESVIQTLGHYLLEDKSPLSTPAKIKVNGKVDKAPFLAVIVLMIKEDRPEWRKDFSPEDSAVISSKDIMEAIMSGGDGEDNSRLMAVLTKGNPKLTKQIAKSHVKNGNTRKPENIDEAMGPIYQFLNSADEMQRMRFEWVLGTPQLMTRVDFKTKGYMYGLGTATMASDEMNTFKSEACEQMGEALLGCLSKNKGRDNPCCTALLNAVTRWCIENEAIARYIFEQPGPSLRFARFSDVLIKFAEEIKSDTEAKIAKSAGRIPVTEKDSTMLETIEVILGRREALMQRFQPWIDEQLATLANASGFNGYHDDFQRVSADQTILRSNPPCYVINEAVEGQVQQLARCMDPHRMVTVTLNQITCKYAWSHPNGNFNLTCPELKLKQPGNFSGVNYFKWCEDNGVAPTVQPAAEDSKTATFDGLARESGHNVLQLLVKPEKKDQMYIVTSITIRCVQDENLNVKLPVTSLKYTSSGKDEKLAFTFVKIDPTKPQFCTGNQFELHVKCKERGR